MTTRDEWPGTPPLLSIAPYRHPADASTPLETGEPARQYRYDPGSIGLPFFRRPAAYTVPGVKPHREAGWAGHSGGQLAARPAVAVALARSPQVFLAVAFADELDALDTYAVHRAELCSYLWLNTHDGMERLRRALVHQVTFPRRRVSYQLNREPQPV